MQIVFELIRRAIARFVGCGMVFAGARVVATWWEASQSQRDGGEIVWRVLAVVIALSGVPLLLGLWDDWAEARRQQGADRPVSPWDKPLRLYRIGFLFLCGAGMAVASTTSRAISATTRVIALTVAMTPIVENRLRSALSGRAS